MSYEIINLLNQKINALSQLSNELRQQGKIEEMEEVNQEIKKQIAIVNAMYK